MLQAIHYNLPRIPFPVRRQYANVEQLNSEHARERVRRICMQSTKKTNRAH